MGSEQCAEALVNTLACAASVFAPHEFEKWKSCVEAGEDSDGCADEMNAALEASERNYTEVVSEPQFTQDASQVAQLKQCGFPGEATQDEGRMNEIINCAAPVVCREARRRLFGCALYEFRPRLCPVLWSRHGR